MAAVATLLITVATVSTVLRGRAETARRNAENSRNAEAKARSIAEASFLETSKQLGLSVDVIRGVFLMVQDELRKRPELVPIRERIVRIAAHDLDKVKDSFIKNPLTARTDAAAAVLMANIYLRIGRVNDAVAIADRALEVVTLEAREHPDDPVATRNLAVVLNLSGDVKLRLGDSPGALARYSEALKTREAWSAMAPERPEPRQSLAESHSILGRLALLNGDPKQALNEYDLARNAYESLPPEILNAINVRREMATLDERRGQARLSLGEVAAAEGLLRAALGKRVGILKEVGDDPSKVLMQRDIALSQLNIGDPVKAWNAYEKALRNFKELLRTNPEGFDARRDLAMILYRAGETAQKLKKAGKTGPPNVPAPEPAAAYFAQCLAIREGLAKIDPKDTQPRIEWMLALARNGRCAEAEPIAEDLLNTAKEGNDMLFQVACGFALTSEGKEAGLTARARDRAFAVLNAMVKNGWQDRAALETDPDLQALRDDPRFKTVVAGLAAKSHE